MIITGMHGPAAIGPRLASRPNSPCIHAYIRNIPLEVLHDTLHGPGPPHNSGDNVHSCISLCSPINYPCRQRRCRICIQVQPRHMQTCLIGDISRRVYFRFRVACEKKKMTVGILIISTQGFKLDIDVMLMRGHSSDCVRTR